MNRKNLRTLLEAAAVTVCLILIAGQQAEAGKLSSETTINKCDNGLNKDMTLVVGQKPIAPSEKALCN
jgi:hypothetical protein